MPGPPQITQLSQHHIYALTYCTSQEWRAIIETYDHNLDWSHRTSLTKAIRQNKYSSLPSFVGSVVALIAYMWKHSRPHVAVANHTLAIACRDAISIMHVLTKNWLRIKLKWTSLFISDLISALSSCYAGEGACRSNNLTRGGPCFYSTRFSTLTLFA